jgi:hypothetical protein
MPGQTVLITTFVSATGRREARCRAANVSMSLDNGYLYKALVLKQNFSSPHVSKRHVDLRGLYASIFSAKFDERVVLELVPELLDLES